jgi:ubiquinone/menaquinone biosynthesis C-methylase UbiE
MSDIVKNIIGNGLYDKEFRVDGEVYPFYSFCQPDSEANWSDQMTIQLEQSSKTHFMDRYNRKIALDGIRKKLTSKDCFYLDMGCSSGYMLEDVLEQIPKVAAVGADYFVAGLLQCHQRLPDVPLFQVDLVNCQFGANLFDAVTCLNVLEHIPDDITALRHLFRIMKPGGELVITVPMEPGLYDIYDQVHHHVRRYQMKELKSKLKSAGFSILKNNYFGVFIYPGFYLIKILNRIRYSNKSESEINEIVFNQIKDTSRLKLMEELCSIEYSLGKRIKYPFGIRGYIMAQRPYGKL